ncbi:MAG: CHRD domain-containing protein [Actinobacteria bacterium]|nr:CHRD domain-containing protein [Actinomycetota bacterium]
MRRSLTLLFIGLVAVLAVAGTAAAKDGGRPLSTTLHGSEEAPAAGDPNATGFAALRLNQGQNRVCYRISWADVDGTVAASHIHRGPAGSAGPVVVNLFVGQTYSGTGSASGCTEGVDAALIKAIRQNPSAYYVNVHSTPNYPGGAIRGQLGD